MQSVAASPTPSTAPVLTYGRPARRNRWNVVLWACALYPVFTLGMIYANGVLAWASLGHWPRPMIDPTVTVLEEFTAGLIGMFTPALLLTAAVAVVGMILVVASDEPTPRSAVFSLLLPFITWGVTILLVVWDPVDVVHWFLD